MIIFLYGPDDYRREEKRREIVAQFVKKHSGMGVGVFDASTPDGRTAFLNFVENQSMFEPVKLAVLENAYETSDKEFIEKLKSFRETSAATILLSETDIPPKSFAFLRAESKAKTKKAPEGNLAQKFEALDGAEWKSFLKKQAKERGANLEPKALDFLAQAYAKDAWRAVTELDKLALLGRMVTQEDLEEFAIELAPNFWATMGALKSPRIGDRLSMLERLLVKNEPAAKLFNILAAQSPDKLQQLARYDAAVKNGKCEYEEVLLDLVLG